MAVHIYSQDRTTGETYNGTWTLNRSIGGTYKVVSQIVDPTPIPWITQNTRKIYITNYANEEPLLTEVDLFANDADFNTYRYSDNISDIVTYIVAQINAVGVSSGQNFSFTGTLINEDTQLKLTATSGYTGILWVVSTCKVIFNKNADEDGTVFYLDLYNLTNNPAHLYMTIDESNLPICTTNTFTPDLILATQDLQLTGQHLRFPSNTMTLTIKLYLINIRSTPIDCNNSWELLLLPGS